MPKGNHKRIPSSRRRWGCGLVAVVLLPLALFAWNGLLLADGEEPVAGTFASVEAPPRIRDRIKILAWNLAKGFVYEGGASFASRQEVEGRMRDVAAVIRAENPDLVFLSEVVTQCTPCDVDQVRFLSKEANLPFWVFGENYNFGLPFFRVVGGNAILSRVPLTPVGNPDLAGRRPFYITWNNRRILWCSIDVGGSRVLLGAMHTDSFDLENNLRQTEQILGFPGDAPTVLAGDFNAEPDTASMAAIAASGRFAGAVQGPSTFPADSPTCRIDYIFGPENWKLVEDRVLDDRSSDHLPVVAVFVVR